MGALMAGAKYKGEYEERVKGVMSDIEKAAEQGQGIILFIDEMHLIMAGRGGDSGGMVNFFLVSFLSLKVVTKLKIWIRTLPTCSNQCLPEENCTSYLLFSKLGDDH